MFTRRKFLGAGTALSTGAAVTSGSLLGGSLLARSVFAQTAPNATAARIAANSGTSDVNGLARITADGGNVIALPGPNGALMIDGGRAGETNAVLDAVFASTQSERVDTLINTHWHPEQVGANEAVGLADGRIFAHETTAMFLSNRVWSVTFDGIREPLPLAARPTQTTRGDGSLDFADTRIDYGYLPAAHTDGDLYVHFPEHNVLAAGGVVSGERWPLIDHRAGAWYGGRVRALEWLAELVDADTLVIPAHGSIITGAEIVRQRDIYRELFHTMIGYMNRGFGPEDAAAAAPLARFDEEFGDASEFIYGAYRSMLIAYVPD